MVRPASREPAPLVTFVRSFTVAKVDSIGFVVRRCFQCSAGKSDTVSSRSQSAVSDSTAFGYFAWSLVAANFRPRGTKFLLRVNPVTLHIPDGVVPLTARSTECPFNSAASRAAYAALPLIGGRRRELEPVGAGYQRASCRCVAEPEDRRGRHVFYG